MNSLHFAILLSQKVFGLLGIRIVPDFFFQYFLDVCKNYLYRFSLSDLSVMQ